LTATQTNGAKHNILDSVYKHSLRGITSPSVFVWPCDLDFGLKFNLLTGTLKQQSSGPLYNNMVTGTLAIDGWAVIFGTATGRAAACPGSSSLYQM